MLEAATVEQLLASLDQPTCGDPLVRSPAPADRDDGTPGGKEFTVNVYGDPRTSGSARRQVHVETPVGAVYREQIGRAFRDPSDTFQDTAVEYAAEMLRRMNCRDALEEMLVGQALLTHARLLRLTQRAARAKSYDEVQKMSHACDLASNTYRRLMLGLSDYRRPASTSSFTAVRQANIAGQQLIQNSEISGRQKATNELGGEHGQDPPLLPADAPGPAITTSVSPAHEALDQVNRPPHTRGQGPLIPERRQARPAVRRGNRTKAPDRGAAPVTPTARGTTAVPRRPARSPRSTSTKRRVSRTTVGSNPVLRRGRRPAGKKP